MTAITTSANAIIEVNQALQTVMKQYLDPESSGSIDIRFDLPDVNSTQSTPTVSVFLYDVHEDLQLRQSDPVRLNISKSALRAGWVNLSCNYLITYWEAQSTGSDGNGPDSSPDNQAAQVMTKTLQALLNNRELSGIAGAFTRIIPPQENLNSLGNFWQALGNRPRLSLMYSVTVPILLENSLPQTLVKTVSSEIVQSASLDLNALNILLKKTLGEQLSEKQGENAQQKLARITVESQQQTGEKEDAFAVNINLVISGLVDSSNKSDLEAILATWEAQADADKGKEGEVKAITEINGVGVYIANKDIGGLNYI